MFAFLPCDLRAERESARDLCVQTSFGKAYVSDRTLNAFGGHGRSYLFICITAIIVLLRVGRLITPNEFNCIWSVAYSSAIWKLQHCGSPVMGWRHLP